MGHTQSMIRIHSKDTLVDIVEKISLHEGNDIILDIPLWHPVLHNYVSLKVLKSKTKWRRLVIATTDKVWRKVGKNLGIEYSLVKNSDFIKKSSDSELMKHNFGFWEYLKYELQSYSNDFKTSVEANKKYKTLAKYSHIYGKKSSLHIFFIIFAWALLLFLFIYYFAISKNYIYITPEKDIRVEAQNFIFSENIEKNILWNNKYIEISTLEQRVYSSEMLASTGINENSNNASKWEVTLFNYYDSPQQLIWGSRLQNSQGIIFQLDSWIDIPPSSQDEFWDIVPGKITAAVTAKNKDTFWNFIWIRWNIDSWVDLILPGLDTESQKMIYAISVNNFTWWSDNFQKVITQNDIENARLVFEEKLKTEALKAIKDTIRNNNSLNNTSLDILPWWAGIMYDDIEIQLEEWISPGIVQDNFSISWNIKITTYLYNKANILKRLRTLVWERMLEGVEKVSFINPDSLRLSQIIYLREAQEDTSLDSDDGQDFEMKATFEIQAILVHDFLNTDNWYIDLLRSKIRWKNKEEALKILVNDPKVSNAEINIRPFFVKSISNISDNIIFQIQ